MSNLQRMTAKALELLRKNDSKKKLVDEKKKGLELGNQGVSFVNHWSEKRTKHSLSMWIPLDGLAKWARMEWNLSQCCWRCFIPWLGLSRNFPVPIDSLEPDSNGNVSEGVEDAFMRAIRWTTRRRGELRVPGLLNRIQPSEVTSDEEDSPAWSLDETEHPVRLVTLQNYQLETDREFNIAAVTRKIMMLEESFFLLR